MNPLLEGREAGGGDGLGLEGDGGGGGGGVAGLGRGAGEAEGRTGARLGTRVEGRLAALLGLAGDAGDGGGVGGMGGGVAGVGGGGVQARPRVHPRHRRVVLQRGLVIPVAIHGSHPSTSREFAMKVCRCNQGASQ